jgi:hypothetical protein
VGNPAIKIMTVIEARDSTRMTTVENRGGKAVFEKRLFAVSRQAATVAI